MKKGIIWHACLLLFCVTARSSGIYPAGVERVLQQSGRNRTELEKAIDYFNREGDPQKIKAIYFLIENMGIHFSADFYWADANGNRVPFRELEYPSPAMAGKALDGLRKQYGKLHAVKMFYRDIDTITGAMLIENTNLAFSVWRSQAHPCSFEDFCEYILPYRVSIEPVQDWRNHYYRRFSHLRTEYESHADSLLLQIGQNIKTFFSNTYGVAGRKDPIPRLGAMQLLFRRKGACEDIVDLAALIARANGYAATVDYVPAWATASGLHYLNYVRVGNYSRHHFDASDNNIIDSLGREPSKVIRTTYSRQRYTAAAMADTSQIPPGYMQLLNYKDVTKEYWATQDVPAELFRLKAGNPPVAFVSVWNFMEWRPVWWGKIADNKTIFTNMCKGVVYLPSYYINRKLVPASWPIVAGLNNGNSSLVLKPDTINTRTIHIREQPKYLAFKTGKQYTLYYWNTGWVKGGVKKATDGLITMDFEHVPSNALLLLVPEYSKRKERPFIITKDGTRYWF